MESVMDREALAFFFDYLIFPCKYHFTSSAYSFIHHQRYKILAADIVVKQHIKNTCFEDAANPVFSLGNGTLLI
jgi:hypothetical protein